jgi:hypothetical protein
MVDSFPAGQTGGVKGTRDAAPRCGPHATWFVCGSNRSRNALTVHTPRNSPPVQDPVLPIPAPLPSGGFPSRPYEHAHVSLPRLSGGFKIRSIILARAVDRLVLHHLGHMRERLPVSVRPRTKRPWFHPRWAKIASPGRGVAPESERFVDCQDVRNHSLAAFLLGQISLGERRFQVLPGLRRHALIVHPRVNHPPILGQSPVALPQEVEAGSEQVVAGRVDH